MNLSFLAESILLLAPGFVFWKAAYISGAQHPRLEWEWVVWSVLASIPLSAASLLLLGLLATTALPPPGDLGHAVTPFVLALALGLLVGRLWTSIKSSNRPIAQRFERQIRDSAWDLVLDEASEQGPSGRPRYGVQVTIEVSGSHRSYYGALDAFGYEGAGADRWIFIRSVSRWTVGREPELGRYMPMARTRGMLFHADKILSLRLIDWPDESPDPASDAG